MQKQVAMQLRDLKSIAMASTLDLGIMREA